MHREHRAAWPNDQGLRCSQLSVGISDVSLKQPKIHTSTCEASQKKASESTFNIMTFGLTSKWCHVENATKKPSDLQMQISSSFEVHQIPIVFLLIVDLLIPCHFPTPRHSLPNEHRQGAIQSMPMVSSCPCKVAASVDRRNSKQPPTFHRKWEKLQNVNMWEWKFMKLMAFNWHVELHVAGLTNARNFLCSCGNENLLLLVCLTLWEKPIQSKAFSQA